MDKLDGETSAATREAAAWFERLNDPDDVRIETEELEQFAAWRRKDPANKAAYEHLEDLSQTLRALNDDPDIEAVAQQALSGSSARAKASWLRRRGRPIIGVALAAVVIGGVSIALTLHQPTYSTGVGQTFSTRLEDGSRVQLNTDSRIRVRYSAGQRRIDLLRGQAYFDVAHNAARPFIVVAGDTCTRAVGTRFDVRRVGETVRVTLAQGSVEITDRDAPASTWKLQPGQALALPERAEAKARPVTVDAKTATSWTTGDLTFQEQPLGEVVAELNRYSRRKIILGAGVDATRLVSGIFPAGDNDDFIAAVSSVYHLRHVARTNGDVELQPKAEST
ncbi:FecR family protein [Caulobacter sp.]|uniref:FecR family protein n=1 Tax=Caulobacter sp. TaxID=78 RepID=UPI0031E0BE24